MPEIIHCPQCERKLRVPEELLGRTVKCPTCGVTFTAPTVAAPEVLPAEEVPEPAPLEFQQEQHSGSTGAAEVGGEMRARQYQEFGPSSRGQRVYQTPHRGTLILVLGILGIVLCGFVAPIAWIMGNQDLKEMRAGRMDPTGEGITNGGRICGMIGTILLVLQCCGVAAMIAATLPAMMDH